MCEAADTDAKLQRMARESAFIDIDHPITVYEAIKLGVMLPVVILKWLCIIVLTVPFCLVLKLLLVGHPPQAPMHPTRRVMVEFWVRLGARLLLMFAGYYYIPIRNKHNLQLAKESRSILIFNHESYVDACAMAALFSPSGVAKSGVATMPVVGLFVIALQFFFIERKGTRDQSNEYVLKEDPITAITQRAADKRFPLVMMAPEATTKAKRCLLKFRRGAFSTGGPVTPILIKYKYKHHNPGWGITNTMVHLNRLMAQFANFMEMEVLPPIHPTPQESRDPMLFADNVRRVMGERLGVPLVDQGVAHERELLNRGVMLNWRGDRVLLPEQAQGREESKKGQ